MVLIQPGANMPPFSTAMSATDDNLAWSLGMESDRMVNSLIRPEDLESEMTVVRNEWEAVHSPMP